MSQTLEAPQPTRESDLDDRVTEHIDREIQQFSYRPVPLLAIIGMVLGILSALAFLGLLGIGLAVLGIITSLAATLKIAFDREAYGGFKIALSGLVLSVLFFGGGTYNQIYLYQNEVPDGYRRISFAHDISRKGFVTQNGGVGLNEDVLALVGEPIFLKAWVFPEGETRDPTLFLVVKDNGLCCFGKQPAPEDSIIVRMDPERFPEGVDYTSGMVSMAGTLMIHPDPAAQLSNGITVYIFEAEYFEKSWTMF